MSYHKSAAETLAYAPTHIPGEEHLAVHGEPLTLEEARDRLTHISEAVSTMRLLTREMSSEMLGVLEELGAQVEDALAEVSRGLAERPSDPR